MPTPLDIHDVLVSLMVTMAASDRAMADSELKVIGDIARMSPLFEGFDTNRVTAVAERAADMLAKDDGLDSILADARAILPPRLRDTAYALAVEVAAADMRLAQEELRFLEMLADALDLDKLTCAAIERSATARYRRL